MSCAQAPPAKGCDGLWGRECSQNNKLLGNVNPIQTGGGGGRALEALPNFKVN